MAEKLMAFGNYGEDEFFTIWRLNGEFYCQVYPVHVEDITIDRVNEIEQYYYGRVDFYTSEGFETIEDCYRYLLDRGYIGAAPMDIINKLPEAVRHGINAMIESNKDVNGHLAKRLIKGYVTALRDARFVTDEEAECLKSYMLKGI